MNPCKYYPVVIIGAGPAGLAAAYSASSRWKQLHALKQSTAPGKESPACKLQTAEPSQDHPILLIERDTRTGGVLDQCIHDGFGLTTYNASLTGPEYAGYELEKVNGQASITLWTDSFVTDITAVAPNDRAETETPPFPCNWKITVHGRGKHQVITAGAVICAMGCRERTAGAIALPGTRPAGIFTAGTAQRLANIQNILVCKSVVIIGSGDIGLIMARRMTLEGVKVACVSEIQPYPGGLDRNIQQCLNDFGIPLYLQTGVVSVQGRDRVESITLAPVISYNPLTLDLDAAETIPCDTILLSVGLIPENELTKKAGAELDPYTGGALVDQYTMTTQPGLFACGNVLQVHDIVDLVTKEAIEAGKHAVDFVLQDGAFEIKDTLIPVTTGTTIRYTVPRRIRVTAGGRDSTEVFNAKPNPSEHQVTISCRVSKPMQQVMLTVIGHTRDSRTPLFSRKLAEVHPSNMLQLSIKLPADSCNFEKLEVLCETL